MPRRSIPACAGEPLRVFSIRGLSPRVRGNLRVIVEQVRPGSIRGAGEPSIPACAGEPRTRSTRGPGRRVYPRVCGGTIRSHSTGPTARGLSPRVRGNLTHCFETTGFSGSIPACAGEPMLALWRSLAIWVYPRVCGGTVHEVGRDVSGEGLSPRVRGNRYIGVGYKKMPGSIPACAGEPPSGRA